MSDTKKISHILVVEDDATQAFLHKRVLQSIVGVDVTAVTTAEEAKTQLDTGQFDGMVINRSLRGDSFAVPQLLANLGHAQRNLPIVVTSASIEDIGLELRQQGVPPVPILYKPFNLEEFATAVRDAFAQKGQPLLIRMPETLSSGPPKAPPSLVATVVESKPNTGQFALLVEDDPSSAKLLGIWLEKRGYNTRIVEKAAEAEDLLKPGHPFNLVITDRGLVDGNVGARFAARLHNEQPNLPVVVFSGNELDTKDDLKAGNAAAVPFLQKPCTREEFDLAVDKAISLKSPPFKATDASKDEVLSLNSGANVTIGAAHKPPLAARHSTKDAGPVISALTDPKTPENLIRR